MNSGRPKRIAIVANGVTGDELKAGRNDSSAVWEVMKKYGEIASKESANFLPDTSLDEFRGHLFYVANSLGPGDQLFLYFSGHGSIEGTEYLLHFGQSIDEQYPFSNMLNDIELRGVRKLVTIVDACYSGAIVAGEKSMANESVTRESLRHIDIPKGHALIAAASKIGKARETSDQTQSYFTKAFLEGIESGLAGTRTKDGLIGAVDLVEFVNERLEGKTQQVAEFGIKGSEHIWIALNRSGDSNDKPVIEEEPRQSRKYSSTEEFDRVFKYDAPEDIPCPGVTAGDLDRGWIDKFAASKSVDISEMTQIEAVKALGLESLSMPGSITVAGTVVFGSNPQGAFSSSAKVVCIEGKKTDPELTVVDFEGPLPEQLDKTYDWIKKRATERWGFRDSHAARTISFDLDFFTAREAIANALIHRDYTSNGEVVVQLDDEQLVVSNPGNLPEGIGLAEPLDGLSSFPRNQLTMFYMRELGYVEQIGRGFAMFNEHLEEHGPDSISIETTNASTVVFKLRRDKSVSQTAASVKAHQSKIVNLPDRLPKQTWGSQRHLIGREEELAKLTEVVTHGQAKVGEHVVYGPIGIGKSSLVVEFCHQSVEQFDLIWWVDASSATSISASYQKFVDARGVGVDKALDLKSQVSNYLGNRENWLVVFDNVVDKNLLTSAKPQAATGSVIAISRNANDWPGGQLIRPINHDQALEWVVFASGGSPNELEEHSSGQLVRALAGYPLGLATVIKFLQSSEGNIPQYLESATDDELYDIDDYAPDDYGLPIFTAVSSVVQHIGLSNSGARKLVDFIAFCGDSKIPRILFEAVGSEGDGSKRGQALRGLLRHSLVYTDGDYLTVPRLLRSSIRRYVRENTPEPVYRSHLVEIADLFEGARQTSLATPHLKSVGCRMCEENIESSRGATILHQVGQGERQIGKYRDSLETLILAESKIDTNSRPVILSDMGELYTLLGKPRQALSVLESAMKLFKSAEVDLRVAEILNPRGLSNNRLRKRPSIDNSKLVQSELIARIHWSMGRALLEMERRDEALKALEMSKGIFKATKGDISEVLISIASCRGSNEYKKAHSELETAFEIKSERYGPNHVEVASVLDGLGLLHLRKGDPKNALTYLEQGLAAKQAHYHYLHPEIAITLGLKGQAQLRLRQFKQSVKTLQFALSINQETFDSDHPTLTATWRILGQALAADEKFGGSDSIDN